MKGNGMGAGRQIKAHGLGIPAQRIVQPNGLLVKNLHLFGADFIAERVDPRFPVIFQMRENSTLIIS